MIALNFQNCFQANDFLKEVNDYRLRMVGMCFKDLLKELCTQSQCERSVGWSRLDGIDLIMF
jgi:hypothetical protein